MYATDGRQTDRQTDVRQKHRLMPRLLWAGHNKLRYYWLKPNLYIDDEIRQQLPGHQNGEVYHINLSLQKNKHGVKQAKIPSFGILFNSSFPTLASSESVKHA